MGLDNLNDYYDTSLKYGRLANLGINKDEIGWYKYTEVLIIQPSTLFV